VTDEDIMEAENMPPMPSVENESIEESEASGQENIQQITMNGAQVAAMVEIVSQVAAGTLPRDGAIKMIMTAFPVSQKEAEGILGEAGRSFKINEHKSMMDKVKDWLNV
jgi:hypothetical protein